MELREMLTGVDYLDDGEASDGLSAVSLARGRRPDLVVMDGRRPVRGCIEAGRRLEGSKVGRLLTFEPSNSYGTGTNSPSFTWNRCRWALWSCRSPLASKAMRPIRLVISSFFRALLICASLVELAWRIAAK